MVRLWMCGMSDPSELRNKQHFDKCERRKTPPRQTKTRKPKCHRNSGRWLGWSGFMIQEPQNQVKPQQQKNIMSQICKAALPKQRRDQAFWWNENTERLRRECFRARRLFTRFRSRHKANLSLHQAECDELYRKYKEAKKAKQLAVNQAKALAWAELLSKIDEEDACVMPLKLMLSRLLPPLVSSKNIDFLEQVVDKLSPDVVFSLRQFTEPEEYKEELSMALHQATPDKILKQVLTLLQGLVGDSTKQLQVCLQKNNFPEIWKLSLLALLKRDGIPSALPLSYKSIPLSCMFESDILFQITHHLNNIDRMYVMDSVGKFKVDACCLLWRAVHQRLKEYGIPSELIHLLGEYLRSCYLVKDMCLVSRKSVLWQLLMGLVGGAMVRLSLPAGV